MLMQWRWPNRQEWLLTAKLLVIMFTAYFAAQLLGLNSPIWAAATAVIIAGGTPGAAARSGLSRIQGTLIGLVAGLLMHLLLGHTLLAAAAGFVAASLLCFSLGFKQEMKLAAITSLMTTLIVQGDGMSSSLLMALWRAGDILLGGAVGIGLSYLLVPQRAARELERHMQEQIRHLGQLGRDILLCYVSQEQGAGDFQQRLRFHETAHELRRTLQRELSLEPADPDLKAQLAARIQILEQLTHGVTALLRTVELCKPEPSRQLLASPLRELADALAECAERWETAEWQAGLAKLVACDEAVQAGFARIYPQLQPPNYTSADLFHLTDVVLWSHRLVHGFGCLNPRE